MARSRTRKRKNQGTAKNFEQRRSERAVKRVQQTSQTRDRALSIYLGVIVVGVAVNVISTSVQRNVLAWIPAFVFVAVLLAVIPQTGVLRRNRHGGTVLGQLIAVALIIAYVSLAVYGAFTGWHYLAQSTAIACLWGASTALLWRTIIGDSSVAWSAAACCFLLLGTELIAIGISTYPEDGPYGVIFCGTLGLSFWLAAFSIFFWVELIVLSLPLLLLSAWSFANAGGAFHQLGPGEDLDPSGLTIRYTPYILIALGVVAFVGAAARSMKLVGLALLLSAVPPLLATQEAIANSWTESSWLGFGLTISLALIGMAAYLERTTPGRIGGVGVGLCLFASVLRADLSVTATAVFGLVSTLLVLASVLVGLDLDASARRVSSVLRRRIDN
jgi:hypothetical protein